ncbi:MAG: sulfatase-like hydrolase/transferase, partial [Verrucomicrobiales bacterium]
MRFPFFLLILLLNTVLASAADSPAGRPNFLFILADDLGFSDLGCYGGEIATPNLDALAADGLRFTDFHNTGRCWPSRGSLLTGYYAQSIHRDAIPGMGGGGKGVRPAWARLVPHFLRPAGYRSYHSGKWHVDGLPLEGGFDRSYLLQDQGRYFSPQMHYEDDVKLPPVAPATGYYGTVAIADHCVRTLRDHAARYPGKPFFHYLAFTAPHFPLQALPADIDRYRSTYLRGWEILRGERYDRQIKLGLLEAPLSAVERTIGPPYPFPDAIKAFGPGEVALPFPWDGLTEAQKSFQATKMAIHAAMVDRIDREIGRVLDQLKVMGAYENTVIFFASDNGASAEMMIRNDGHNPA